LSSARTTFHGTTSFVCPRKHLIASLAVLLPERYRLLINWTDFPLLQGVPAALFDAFLLLALADVQVVLDKTNAGTHEHAFEFLNACHELLKLLVSAESHYVFHAGPVIPTAIEECKFTGGWEFGSIALEVP